MTYELRPYQSEAIARCFNMWEGAGGQKPLQRLAIQLPTGAGKTVVFCRLIRQAREERAASYSSGAGTGTALVLAHRDELVQQAVDKLRHDDPTLRVGVAKAARNEVTDIDVIVGSVQTLCRDRRLAQLPPIDLVIVDEAHHATAASYRKILEHVGCWRAGGPWLLGVSATLERADGSRLADVFEEIAYQVDILDLVEQGYLVEPRAKLIGVEDFDLASVHTRAGDLADNELAAALDKSGAYGVVAAAYLEHARDRAGIVFCPNISTAERMAAVLNEWGVSARALSSRTSAEDRVLILERYQDGHLQVIVNCSVLTEGFDAPHTSVVVIARPTKSRVLYSQMVGRGLRLSEGKTDCLVLDLVGSSGRHQLCTVADLTSYDIAQVTDGETLTEARSREARVRAEKQVRTRGTLRARDVDLLRRETDSVIRSGWFLLTAAGVPFIKVTDKDGEEAFFWVEEIVGYDHVVMYGEPGSPPVCLTSGLKLSQARDEILREARQLVSVKAFLDPSARWRRDVFEECKPGQLAMAERLGIDVSDRPSKGELSDRITVCTVGVRIDRWIAENRYAEAA